LNHQCNTYCIRSRYRLDRDATAMTTPSAQHAASGSEDVFRAQRRRLWGIAYRLTGSAQDAEDVVQETLIVVNDHFSEFVTVERLLAFTNKVMRNKIGNFYRKRDRQRHYQVEWDKIPDLVYYMDEELDAAELDRIIQKAIDQLGEKSPVCRAILLGLREGLSIGELSRWLGLSRPKIDNQVFRCRRALRRILLKDYNLQV